MAASPGTLPDPNLLATLAVGSIIMRGKTATVSTGVLGAISWRLMEALWILPFLRKPECLRKGVEICFE